MVIVMVRMIMMIVVMRMSVDIAMRVVTSCFDVMVMVVMMATGAELRP